MGDLVELVDHDGSWIGYGLCNPESRILCRLYSWSKEIPIDETLIADRLRSAMQLRHQLVESSSTPPDRLAQRICFSEADRLSGLIIDRFGKHFVIQITAAGMLRFLDTVCETLKATYAVESISLLIDPSTAVTEGLEETNEVLFGTLPSEPITIDENSLAWSIDLRQGQKTGWYLDQSTNRAHAAHWLRNSKRILDVCCYTGGFAITAAARNRNAQIVAIDSSHKALEIANHNAALNSVDHIEFIQGDAFDYLRHPTEGCELFDAIVLDPPKLAGSRNKLPAALRAYHRLNFSAVKQLLPGGLLITCSCSGRLSREEFRQVLLGVSKRSGRDIQILHQRGAAVDHPSLATCPETDYLKFFICRVF